MTSLSPPSRSYDRRQLSFDQFLACRTNARPAKCAFGHTKLLKSLVHGDSEEGGIALVDFQQPVPFVIRQVLARDQIGILSNHGVGK